MDGYAADRFTTYDRENQSIRFNSETVEEDKYDWYGDMRDNETPEITTCAWIYGAFIGNYRYKLKEI